ncbi:MAG: respiratory nitrate reductase subunit gamma [Gammaproteobacteria bacterium]|jgi:nitrate reductase gamma subunit|nr:MAG: respiratory nitrate reductase subunit gamma [Gammaproteobacteria bacterium]
MTALNNFLFIAFPYIAIGIFLVGSVWRYRTNGFKVSALSSQFLEGKAGFWGIVPFHIGILVLFLGHLFVFLFPETVINVNANPVRLVTHEGIAFTFGISVLVGLIFLMTRRLTHPRILAVTTKMDIVIELLLLSQILLGCWVALGYRWGSSWFASDLSPYLWSIFKLNPDITAVAALPVAIKLHIVGAFTILLLIPFTRLIHFLVAPFHYLFRPYQVVMWNWDKNAIREPRTAWQIFRPRNN